MREFRSFDRVVPVVSFFENKFDKEIICEYIPTTGVLVSDALIKEILEAQKAAVVEDTSPAMLWDKIQAHPSMSYAAKINALAKIASDSEQVMAEVNLGKKISAIKALREITSCGLKDGKEAIEKIVA